MATRRIFKYPFTLAAGTTNVELPAMDLSQFDELELEIDVDTSATDAGDTLDVYLQSRGPAGIWDDRIATAQILGTASDNEVRKYAVQQFGTFADSEEASEPQGSAGGSHLTAGSVKNGPFPPPYRSAGVGTLTAWRLQFVMVDADADGSFTGTVYIFGNSGLGCIPRSYGG
jgi:hypothetical protein